jgi:hypothetical protein
MIHRVLPPLQDSKSTCVIAGVGIVVREAVAYVSDVLLGLSFVKVSGKHMFKVREVFSLNFAMIRHLYHGIHEVSGQFKVPEHVFAFQSRDTLVIVAHQPRSNDHITTAEPIVANFNIGKMTSPFNTLDIALVAIIKVVIARNKIYSIKVVIHVLQCSETVVQRDDVQAGSVVVPISEKHAGFTTFRPGFGSGPLHKVQAVLVVSDTVTFEPKVNVREDRGFAE